MDILDQLYADRGELLDLKNLRAQCLLASKGCYYPDTDFSDIDKRVGDITEQIEIVTAVEWLSENEEPMSETSDEYKQYARLASASESDNLYGLGMGR
jgi:hypothetical protein